MGNPFTLLVFFLGFLLSSIQSKLVENEEVALREIIQTMGATQWKFDDVSCQVEMVGVTPHLAFNSESDITCDCQHENNTCHVVKIVLKGLSLPGVLPRELVKLPYLREIDFAYNYLSGGIPVEWTSMHLNSISLLVNRLSGEIPKELGNISNLTALNLGDNQFTGKVPDELGNLMNLKMLVLSSNHLSGTLPQTLARLKNLTDLEMHASGLQGPIPSAISSLNGLTELRISDIYGSTQEFPDLRNMPGLVRLVLRNCNIAGEFPPYLWKMKYIKMLDVSFNNLVGEIPDDGSSNDLKFIFLTGNMLSGSIPSSLLQDGRHIDLSYNNFTWQDPEQPTCRQNTNFNINLYRSSSTGVSLKGLLPCSDSFDCPRYGCSLHINCGGDDLVAEDENRKYVYEGDGAVGGGIATYFRNNRNNWGFSATGDFMDDDDSQSIRHVKNLPGSNLFNLYATARISPITLTYFAYCLENGNYTVKLHFAEIQFTNDKTYKSLGNRVFDIYIQDILVQKDFNIEGKARGAEKPVVIVFKSTVTNNSLEIRFNWAGRGTTRIPTRGVYGPLISAISVNPVFRRCSRVRNKRIVYISVGIISFLFLVFGLLIIVWWKGCYRVRTTRDDLGGLQIQAGGYTLNQIKSATNNFNPSNKIGEGGFGPVYKGLLPDGTLIAVKQLSSKSKQGNHEFLNEIGMISCLQHKNLVKLHGFCVEGDQLLLVYEYMENNSLAGALLGRGQSQIFLDWQTRVKICLGIARGLAFLHEDSRLRIVHRDIKATNVLLDQELNPKISDFGLARLGEDDNSHVSTRVAGTIGYMAPEYAIWGHLSYKVDVYSFGIVTLEIISGRSNSCYVPTDDFFCLLDWACHLQQSGNYLELVDQRLGCNYNIEEAEKIVNVALICTNAAASERPTMSEVVNMLEGKMAIPDEVPDFRAYTNDLRFRSIKGIYQHRETLSESET
ncbi:probable LRR receptor-like serine/threonine-protein kinase RFK1 isoform X3 [Beta vulgaris subsp. vulgaris]|uniref:probable LRR receptor-like serine/threonine-protein kinase RFK1 isoform X3 n=1 Tax=Beta vulgaris subsp. vulgaris TaxID=3555 RepID=UPI0020375E57|nr:probable LRR receptor-like serine/threonine-protein kinase RFK1 isoform X3 [Beta vulgaris subsp. vulgaris]